MELVSQSRSDLTIRALVAVATPSCRSGLRSQCLPGIQAALRGFEFRKPTAFLFHQVVFHPAHGFAGHDDFLPRRDAFSKENPISLLLCARARSPILEM